MTGGSTSGSLLWILLERSEPACVGSLQAAIKVSSPGDERTCAKHDRRRFVHLRRRAAFRRNPSCASLRVGRPRMSPARGGDRADDVPSRTLRPPRGQQPRREGGKCEREVQRAPSPGLLRGHGLEGREEAEGGEGEERQRGGADEDRLKSGHGGEGWLGTERGRARRGSSARCAPRERHLCCGLRFRPLRDGANEFDGARWGYAESVSRADRPGLRLALRERSRVALAR